MGDHAFCNCVGLTSVVIPNSVTSIENGAFSSCDGLISLTIGNSVTSIGNSAFSYCVGLTSVTIPNSVTSIDKGAFWGCAGLTSLTIGNSVTSIGDYAFYDCNGISELTFEDGESELTISAFAFASASYPTKIYFGRQMNFTAVPISSALETVDFGENVTAVEPETFKWAKSLRSVIARSLVPPITESTFANETYLYGTLYVPAMSIKAYEAADGWRDFSDIVCFENSAIPEISDTGKLQVGVEAGAICVVGGAYVRIMAMNGATVYSGRCESRINVVPGVYVVIVGDTATKVVVK